MGHDCEPGTLVGAVRKQTGARQGVCLALQSQHLWPGTLPAFCLSFCCSLLCISHFSLVFPFWIIWVRLESNQSPDILLCLVMLSPARSKERGQEIMTQVTGNVCPIESYSCDSKERKPSSVEWALRAGLRVVGTGYTSAELILCTRHHTGPWDCRDE